MPDDMIRSADVMADKLKDTGRLDEAKADTKVLDAVAADAKKVTDSNFQAQTRAAAFETDRVVYRMTTRFLGAAVITIAVGIILLRMLPMLIVLFHGKDGIDFASAAVQIPESLVALASTAVGALAGLLSPLTGNRQG